MRCERLLVLVSVASITASSSEEADHFFSRHDAAEPGSFLSGKSSHPVAEAEGRRLDAAADTAKAAAAAAAAAAAESAADVSLPAPLPAKTPVIVTDATKAEARWKVLSHRTCSGMETYWDACPNLPPCKTCEPQNCVFVAWSDWSSDADCNGLCRRTRNVDVANNDCGKPCSGVMTQTKICVQKACQDVRADCAMALWREWTACDKKGLHQSSRTRVVLEEAKLNGKACTDDLSVTRPCGHRIDIDCTFHPWEAWTSCGGQCDSGHRSRSRQVAVRAQGVGKPCVGELHEEASCKPDKCKGLKPVACVMGAWTAWNGCNGLAPIQASRTRDVITTAKNGGRRCSDNLKEVKSCLLMPTDCQISAWSEWTACDATCDGGQQTRMRSLVAPAKNGGTCIGGSMMEVTACGTGTCHPPGPKNCKMGSWTPWTPCNAVCGEGHQERSRRVEFEAQPGGIGCSSAVKEISSCHSVPCIPYDCRWGAWTVFDACDAKCGGGMKKRSRAVAQSPKNNGLACKAQSQAEVAACNTQPCADCIDGEWALWGTWSACTATCGSGYRSRHRSLAMEPSYCGKPASGPTTEYVGCPGVSPCFSRDCKLSEWEPWSACSDTCFGVTSRKRSVLEEAVGPGSKSCAAASTEQVGPCFKGTKDERKHVCQGTHPARDCTFGSWSQWTVCTASCGPGQRSRQRSILNPLIGDGAPCKGDQSETKPCDVAKCVQKGCVDCELGDWSSWSTCHAVGWPDRRGQRMRSRSVVKTGNHCGKPCTPGARLKETDPCLTGKKVMLTTCTWSEWGTWSGCTSSKCTASKTRAREYSPVEEYATPENVSYADFNKKVFDRQCKTDKQVSHGACGQCIPELCQPKDLQLAVWSSWQSDSSAKLCNRARTTLQAKNKCGGYLGKGNFEIAETKSCDSMSNLTACHLGAWQTSPCTKATDLPFRVRAISGNFPKMCKGFTEDSKGGVLKDTQSCVEQFRPKRDCLLQAWGAWSACSSPAEPCKGLVKRTRTVTGSQSSGKPCDAMLSEGKECPNCVHKAACDFTAWTSWSATCDSTKYCYQVRTRGLATDATVIKTPCIGSMKEFKSMPDHLPQDCSLAAWSQWSLCNQTCHGGQSGRYRQVTDAKRGGKACAKPSSTLETRACNTNISCPTDPKSVDCIFNVWGNWSACSATCGWGMESRLRTLVGGNADGKGCTGKLSENRACGGNFCKNFFDCIVHPDWSTWSACSASCGTGFRSRLRNITQFPEGGGKPCDAKALRKEVAACATNKCPTATGLANAKDICIDATWDQWTSLGMCSSTCAGGHIQRVRKQLTQANHCGKPLPAGPSQEVVACNTEVPCFQNISCQFFPWSAWGVCTASKEDPCSGMQTRSRTFSKAVGLGKPCKGSLLEAVDCSPSVVCATPKPVDCEFAPWTSWGVCDKPCGGGQMNRTRSQLGNAAGKPCAGSTWEIAPCNTNKCTGPVDCTYGLWGDWGPCEDCGGQRSRTREILHYPSGGGKACQAGDVEETGQCSRDCNQLFCAWGNWKEWSKCSAVCGAGKRSRTRHLGMVRSTPPSRLWDANALDEQSLEDRLQELYRRQRSAEASRGRDLCLAFSLGAVALLAFLAIGNARSVKSSRRIRTSNDWSPSSEGEREDTASSGETPTISNDWAPSREGEREDTARSGDGLVAEMSLSRSSLISYLPVSAVSSRSLRIEESPRDMVVL